MRKFRLMLSVFLAAALLNPAASQAEMKVVSDMDCNSYQTYYTAPILAVYYVDNAWNIQQQKYEKAVLMILNDGTNESNRTVVIINGADLPSGLALMQSEGHKMELTINGNCSVHSIGLADGAGNSTIKPVMSKLQRA